MLLFYLAKHDAVLSQGGPRDAAVNFCTYYSGVAQFHCNSNAFELNNSINHGKIAVLNIFIYFLKIHYLTHIVCAIFLYTSVTSFQFSNKVN